MTKKCSNCGGPVQRAYVLDSKYGGDVAGFAYSLEPPKIGWLNSGAKNAVGTIHGYVCSECDAVTFYAHPGEDPINS